MRARSRAFFSRPIGRRIRLNHYWWNSALWFCIVSLCEWEQNWGTFSKMRIGISLPGDNTVRAKRWINRRHPNTSTTFHERSWSSFIIYAEGISLYLQKPALASLHLYIGRNHRVQLLGVVTAHGLQQPHTLPLQSLEDYKSLLALTHCLSNNAQYWRQMVHMILSISYHMYTLYARENCTPTIKRDCLFPEGYTSVRLNTSLFVYMLIDLIEG